MLKDSVSLSCLLRATDGGAPAAILSTESSAPDYANPLRVLNIGRVRRLLDLAAVEPVGHIPDLAAFEEGARDIRAS